MAQGHVVLKVVCDTNTVISATLFENGLLKPLRLSWKPGQVIPVISVDTRAELLRVLAYEKFKLSEADIARALTLYLPHAQLHAVDLSLANRPKAPICRDKRDQMFLEVAYSAKVDCLVSGDQDLLVLSDTSDLPFQILKPVEFLTRLQLLP